MFRKLMAAINAFLAVGVLAFGTPAQAQAVKAGIMTCNVAGGFGFIFGSSRAVNCTFAPDGVAPQHYVGAINKFGVDIGYVEGAVMAWAVLAPTNNPGPGLLAGARARIPLLCLAGPGALMRVSDREARQDGFAQATTFELSSTVSRTKLALFRKKLFFERGRHSP